MRSRTFIFAAVFGLLVAACSPGEDAAETTTTSEPATTTTEAPPAPEAVELSYALEAGASYTYEVEMDQSINLTTSGDAAALSEEEGGEEIPENMSLQVKGTSVFTHDISDGPEPGTFEVHITGDFSDLEFSGTIDGEPVDETEIPDLGTLEPVDVTIIVDENGNPIQSDELGDFDLFGALGGSESSSFLDPSAFGANSGAGQFVGPPFGDEPVTVGDTWSETIEVPFMPDSDPIVTQIDSEVVGTDTVEGNDVFVIETQSTTSAFEFDLADLLIGFMLAFIPDDATDEERAEMDLIAEQMKFAFGFDETNVQMTTWFDAEAGLSRMAEIDLGLNMIFDIAMPDEETGEVVEFALNMDLDQSIVYKLIEASSA